MALKTRVVLCFGVAALSVSAMGAQELPPPVAPPPVTVVPPAPVAAPTPIDVTRRREQIGLMEGLLAAAVRNGAQDTARQIQAVQPGLQLFTGMARAQGFFLEGYGVFFHVEIPGVQPSVEWILEALERARVGRQSGGQATLTGGARSTPMLDANAIYTEAVQQRLIGAMLDLRIDLLPEEWLTVAARDGAGPMAPGQIYESITMVLRIKGADLANFRAGRITLEALRGKVEVREF